MNQQLIIKCKTTRT